MTNWLNGSIITIGKDRHSALKGKTPIERYFELSKETPFSDEVQNQYNLSDERIQNANCRVDLEIAKLKRSL